MEPELVSRTALASRSRLIHCITNPISINDCANMVLAMGAQPMMAEHPAEAADITAGADALALNLGNVTDARLAAMRLSLARAHSLGIPAVLDCVGVGCSPLRLDYARALIRDCCPQVLKGNLSEWKALCGRGARVGGVDLSAADRAERVTDHLDWLAAFARAHGTVALVSGAEDLITDGRQALLVSNGHPMLARLTGTGCMLNVLTAVWLSAAPPLTAALQACAVLGLCGERAAAASRGPGSLRANLLDEVYALTDQDLRRGARIRALPVPNPANQEA